MHHSCRWCVLSLWNTIPLHAFVDIFILSMYCTRQHGLKSSILEKKWEKYCALQNFAQGYHHYQWLFLQKNVWIPKCTWWWLCCVPDPSILTWHKLLCCIDMSKMSPYIYLSGQLVVLAFIAQAMLIEYFASFLKVNFLLNFNHY